MSAAVEKTPKKKVAAPPAHPQYKDMIVTAVTVIKERKGASRQAIVKYIAANYKVGDSCSKHVTSQLKKCLANGVLVDATNKEKKSANSRFKLSDAAKTAANKKPAVKKPAKKPAAPKKKTVAKPKKPTGKTAKKSTKKATKSPAKAKKSPAKAKVAPKKTSAGRPKTKKAATKKPTPKKGVKKPAAKKTPKPAKK